MKNSILIGISGGVDSAVTALLLQREGYDVTGCRLLLGDGGDPSEGDAAAAVADRLGIRLVTADFREDFKKEVTEYFIEEYRNGRTPNPCVRCNPSVKFASLRKVADKLGIEKIATGHYAKIKESGGVYYVHASPSKKDQSYFLYRLGQDILCRTVFPLGEYTTKEEIRAIARDAGFEAAEKKDSQEICFIPDNDYIGYIINKTGMRPEPGDFIDMQGSVIGTHSGIIHYTVGQRKGLGAFGEPRYVKYINAKDNTVTLCKADERFCSEARIDKIFWTAGSAPDLSGKYGVKIRSTAKAVPASVRMNGDTALLLFDTPVMAPCPGQSAVIYDGDTVVGGGIVI